jgi:DNA-binding GntR family transcriptional regulator
MTGKPRKPASQHASRGNVEGNSIQARIENELRNRILHGSIKPGGRINVRQLEQVFGVSHIPIREAIRRLEAEGLVVNVPQRGAVAAAASLNELDDVYDLRRIVEPQVLRRAVAKISDTDRAAIETAFFRLERSEQGAKDIPHSEAHWDFHWSVLAPGATGEIERLVHKLWRVADRYVRLTNSVVVDVAHEHHLQIFQACLAGDGEEAAAVLETHLHLTGDALRSRFNQIHDTEHDTVPVVTQ